MKKLLSEYVTFLVAINTVSNNFKYPHAGKSQNIFGNMNLKPFCGNVFPLRFSYFFSKNHREFGLFMIAKEISKSEFFAIFWKRQREITL